MKILEKQGYHLLILLLLLLGVFFTARGEFLAGEFWGLTTKSWLRLSILMPVIHQVYVLICWRAELHYGWLTKIFGEQAFSLWAAGFMILFLSRPITITGLALANRGTLTLPGWLSWILAGGCLILVVYLLYSFKRFFGVKRALGMDHFQPEIYRDFPMVKQGIFRWTNNSMYVFGFLFFWIPGLLLNARAALLAALFNHLYIWVHYYFTEYPDMQFIYQDK
ncbi:MAG: hypothetical protein MUP11_07815 [Anaerolineales bacterium]|nr:hypothetical protein [Anaerolineales bacterium]